ncbi:MAG: hypothetical protein K6G87_01705 [Butyrivibrio sp.]|uniref:hypothetical protein n=1 Tax=Butyrivibrio sp. TaxID=28121 RepID=UPI0025CE3D01|nr:hypothetical protein [Butyrivibrio sp.]MCR5769930.1 hypothetical protein [Butyrivibrio sp.]
MKRITRILPLLVATLVFTTVNITGCSVTLGQDSEFGGGSAGKENGQDDSDTKSKENENDSSQDESQSAINEDDMQESQKDTTVASIRIEIDEVFINEEKIEYDNTEDLLDQLKALIEKSNIETVNFDYQEGKDDLVKNIREMLEDNHIEIIYVTSE